MESTLWQLLFQRRMCGSLRQQKRAPPKLRCRTESRNLLRLWTTRIPARRKPLRLTTEEQVKSPIQKKCERDEPKRCESLMNSKLKWKSMSQKSDRHRARKSGQNRLKHVKDPNSSAIRCRLCATEVNTGESRSDTFAATPPLKFVRLILSWAASYKPKRANASMINHCCV